MFKTTSKSKSSEIVIIQVLEPNMALGNLKHYTDKKCTMVKSTVTTTSKRSCSLLIDYDGKTFYDDQK